MAVQLVQAIALAKTCYDVGKEVKSHMEKIRSRETEEEIDHGATFDAQMPDQPLRPVPGLSLDERDRVMAMIAQMGGEAPMQEPEIKQEGPSNHMGTFGF